MGFDFTFRSVETKSDRLSLIDFLRQHNPGYPNYDKWTQRVESELDIGYKRGIIALSGGDIVADLICQPEKTNNSFLELKNLRVHPYVMGRNFARFMLRQMEIENPGYFAVICDVRKNQRQTISFLESLGYGRISEVPLYEKDVPEVIMVKPLGKSDGDLSKRIFSVSKKIILARAA